MPTPRIDSILEKYGFKRSPQTTWTVQGNPVIYHHVLEVIAIDLEIEWLPPHHSSGPRAMSAWSSSAAIWTASMSGRIGEARIEANYRVSGKQAAYVYAMAEKRGKDRLIYKFLGLADATEPEEMAEQPDVSKMTIEQKLRHNIGRKATLQELSDYVLQPSVKSAIGGLGPDELGSISNFIQERRAGPLRRSD